MTRLELAQNIMKVAHLTGEFKLRSGQISHEYFDKYRFESNPELLKAIAEKMSALLPANTQILAGLEMGGIPIATAIALHTGLPLVFIRKKAKDYGTCKFAEGIDIRNKQLTLIEDVVTTGGQVFLSANDLISDGAHISAVLSVIDRGENSKTKMLEKGLHFLPLFTAQELKDSLK